MKNKKVLHLVRHAKSSWDYENISDVDRPLKIRGIKNAYDMARRIKIKNLVPDQLITSPANRALHTATIFARVIELPFTKIMIEPLLYNSSPDRVITFIKEIDNTLNSVMIFGHNPEFTDLANMFIQGQFLEVPTTGIVSIIFETSDWSGIEKENVTGTMIDFPKKDLQATSF
jgi:phosphohistidine phosphatase